MRQLQTYELTKDEHKSLLHGPLSLPTDPQITIVVAGRRNGVSLQVAPTDKLARKSKKALGLTCSECGTATTAHGKPFKEQGLAAHKFKAHGIRKNGKRGRKSKVAA